VLACSVHYREVLPGEQKAPWTQANTSVTSAILENLKPNTQYQVEIVAICDKGSSLPSETMLLWTDPALPAIVEVGTYSKSSFKVMQKGIFVTKSNHVSPSNQEK
jgi:Fibronectin type III domain